MQLGRGGSSVGNFKLTTQKRPDIFSPHFCLFWPISSSSQDGLGRATIWLFSWRIQPFNQSDYFETIINGRFSPHLRNWQTLAGHITSSHFESHRHISNTTTDSVRPSNSTPTPTYPDPWHQSSYLTFPSFLSSTRLPSQLTENEAVSQASGLLLSPVQVYAVSTHYGGINVRFRVNRETSTADLQFDLQQSSTCLHQHDGYFKRSNHVGSPSSPAMSAACACGPNRHSPTFGIAGLLLTRRSSSRSQRTRSGGTFTISTCPW